MGILVDQFGHSLSGGGVSAPAERGFDKDDVGKNLTSSVMDVHKTPPFGWEEKLRAESPKSEHHSWLQFYYYRLKDRWVLYDLMPIRFVDPDKPIQPGLLGSELLAALRGRAPRDLSPSDRTPFVSDVQHEFHRLYQVYAVPWWVLEGENGGHQVAYNPIQRQHLTELNLPIHPPQIGSLPACPFDERVLKQIRRMNRLAKLGGNIDRLRNSGSPEAWAAEQDEMDREVRIASLEMLEQQLGETVEMVQRYGHRKDTRDSVIDAKGKAALASEALAAYVETGDYIM